MKATTATWAARSAAALIPNVFARLPVDDRTVYLTFDDGPSGITSAILDLLGESDATATFFLQGDQAERYPSVTRQIADGIHGIGNHSYRHLDAWRNRWASIERDLDRGSRAIEEAGGGSPMWMRPPYGRLRAGTLAWCKREGRQLALWDVMAEDFRKVRPDSAAARVVKCVRPGSIVVLHDGDLHQPVAFDVTKRVVKMLRESGWSLERLPDAPRVPV